MYIGYLKTNTIVRYIQLQEYKSLNIRITNSYIKYIILKFHYKIEKREHYINMRHILKLIKKYLRSLKLNKLN